jgi:uncharacterized short protein YbdD (DUF466 family)
LAIHDEQGTQYREQAPLLQSLETLLESEVMEPFQARNLALCILNYERNLHHQRERYPGSPPLAQHKPSHAARYLKRAANQLTQQCKGLKN